MNQTITKVPIRFLFVMDDEEVVAICPDNNVCYVHAGQHSSYDPFWLYDKCRKAIRREYQQLLEELTYQIGYNVEVLNDYFDIEDLF